MPTRAAAADRHPPEPAPAVTPPDDIALFDMANLRTEKTGAEEIIHISTARGSHGACVKWCPARPARDAPCAREAPCLSGTIEPVPQSFNHHHLATRALDVAYPAVAAWVTLNAASWPDFCDHGSTWLDGDVTAFKQTLRRLPPRG
jgi:hypothetical protein